MVLENVKEMWTELPRTGKGKKKVSVYDLVKVDIFPIRNGLKQGDVQYRHSFSTLLWSMPLRGFR
jgi:translation initiation factor IF-1